MMGIRFLCPNGHKLNVKADLAGKRASCPECGAKLQIPGTSGEPVVAPAAIVVNPSAPAGAVWFLQTTSGEQLGPASEAQFSNWIAAGRVTTDAHVWRDGWAEWKQVSEVTDLLPMPPAAVPQQVAEPALPVIAAAEVADPEPAQAVIAGVPDLDPSPIEAVLSESIKSEPAATYAIQRTRSKKTQLTLAVVMLAAVVVLAGVLIWVIRSNTAEPAPISFLEQPAVMGKPTIG
jgi:GYF domain 2